MEKFWFYIASVMLALTAIMFTSTNDTNVANAYGSYVSYDSCDSLGEQDFADDRVLVILNSTATRRFEDYSVNSFSEIECESVAVLNKYCNKIAKGRITSKETPSDSLDVKKINVDEYRTILSLKLKTKSKQNVLETIKILKKRDDVMSAEPDYIMKSFADPNPTPTKYINQWGLTKSQMPLAWDITTGSNAVVVGVTDSGIDVNHFDLQDSVVQNKSGDFTVGSTTNIIPNYDDNHGTWVAGIINAHRTGGTAGVIGVAPDIKIASLKINNPQAMNVQNRIDLYVSSTIRALDFAKEEGIPIISHSAGYLASESSLLTRQALELSIAQYGGLFVCSAGNDYEDSSVYPSHFTLPNILSVGASNGNDERWSRSCYSSTAVDLFAPGQDIVSTNINNTYLTESGTSASAPFVAGVAALILSIDPSATVAEIKESILDAAIPCPAFEGKCVTGGRLDAYNALNNYIYNTTDLPNNCIRIDSTNVHLIDYVIPATINGKTVTQIGDSAFSGHNTMQTCNFEAPGNITAIGDRAFMNCTSLIAFSVPNNVTSIGNRTFANCGNLTMLGGASVASIGDYAFSGTTLQVNSTIPASVASIGQYAFSGSDFADDFSFPANSQLRTINAQAFAYCQFDKLIIPSYVTNIGDYAFGGCDNLTLYVEPSSRPSTWSSIWNDSDRPVFWGCMLSEDKTYVVSFVKSASNPSNTTAVNGITNPVRKNNTFGGWYTTSDFSGTQYMDVTAAPNGTLYAKWNSNSSSCVAEGSLITLADGRQVAVEELTGNENLLVWDLFTGTFGSAPILFIDSDPYAEYEIIRLRFSDGTEVKVIDEHAFWDVGLNRYVFLREDAAQYVGHFFNKQTLDGNGNMIWTEVELVSVDVYTQYTTAWSPVTYGHLCYYVNGMLTMPGATEGLINIFDVDEETMRYDQAAFEADVAAYGLFTYEEFAAVYGVSETVFDAFGGQYLKIAMGKGLLTEDMLTELIERYSVFFNDEDAEEETPAPAPHGNRLGHREHTNCGRHRGRGNGRHGRA